MGNVFPAFLLWKSSNTSKWELGYFETMNLQLTKSCENSEQTSHILMVYGQHKAKYYCNIIATISLCEILIIIDNFSYHQTNTASKCVSVTESVRSFRSSTIVDDVVKKRFVI